MTAHTHAYRDPILTLSGVSIAFNGEPILRDINAQVLDVTRPNMRQGQVVGFYGRSGRKGGHDLGDLLLLSGIGILQVAIDEGCHFSRVVTRFAKVLVPAHFRGIEEPRQPFSRSEAVQIGGGRATSFDPLAAGNMAVACCAVARE